MSRLISKSALPFLVLLLLISAAGTAQAQELPIFNDITAENDVGTQWVEALFQTADGGPSPLSQALSAFAMTLLAVAGLMVGWHIVAGTVSAAHEGRFLGGQWHQIYAPVRVVIGVGLLVPVFNGMTVGHMMVEEVAKLSSQMATTVWRSFAEEMIDNPQEVPMVRDLGGKELVYDVAQKAFCVKALQAIEAPAKARFNVSGPTSWTSMSDIAGSVATSASSLWRSATGTPIWQWPTGPRSASSIDVKLGDMTGFMISPAYAVGSGLAASTVKRIYRAEWDFGEACGAIHVQVGVMDLVGEEENDTAVDVSAQEQWATKQVENLNKIIQGIGSSALIDNYVGAVKPGAGPNAIAAKPTPEQWVQELVFFVEEYDLDQRNAAKDYILAEFGSADEKLKRRIEGDGWVSSGVYWRVLSMRAKAFLDSAQGSSVQSGGDASEVVIGSAEKSYARMNENFQKFMRGAFPGEEIPSFKDISGEYQRAVGRVAHRDIDGEQSLTSLIRGELKDVTQSISQQVVSLAGGSDPFGALMGIGHGLVIGATAFYTGAIAAVGIGTIGTAGGVTGIGPAIGPILGTAINAITAFLGFIGVMYAYVLPMLPFLYIIFLALGWLIVVMEAAVAIIVWAFFWVRMDGQNLVESVQRPGAMILFNLLIRPTIGILALCMIYYLLPIVLEIINRYVVDAFFMVQGDSWVALVGFLASIGITFYLHYQIILRVTALIVELPDRVTRWFGMPSEGLNESGNVGTAMAAFGGAAMGSSRQPAQGVAAFGQNVEKAKQQRSAQGANPDGGNSASAPRGNA